MPSQTIERFAGTGKWMKGEIRNGGDMRFQGFSRTLGIFCTALLVLCLAPSSFCQDAQNFSGLLNKDLVTQNDAGAIIGDLIFSRHRGKITGVKVLDDKERSLIIQVVYSEPDLSKPKLLSVQVQGEDGKTLPDS